MSPPPTVLPPGVDELLKALREAGLPVGTREILRLHRVFSLEPDPVPVGQAPPADDALEQLLLAGLVHSPDERLVFEPIYREWRERWRRWEAVSEREDPAGLQPERAAPTRRQERSRRPIRRAASRLAVLMVALAAVWLHAPSIAPPAILPPPPPPHVAEDLVSEDGFRILPQEPVPEKRTIWVPSIQIENTGRIAVGSFSILGLALLLSGAALAVWGFQRPLRSPRRLAPPSLPGPRRAPYLPLPHAGPDLLDADGARTLVWGVGRHQTEDLTPEIDLDRTADATARSAGIPELRHVPENRLREVSRSGRSGPAGAISRWRGPC